MPTTWNLGLTTGYNRTDKNSKWVNEKDRNYLILDEAIGAVFNGATENGIEIKESENHIDWDEE